VNDKWLDVESYEEPAFDSEATLTDTQMIDAERRAWGISTIELRTSWRGRAHRVGMLLNRGMQTETLIELGPEQIARLIPILISSPMMSPIGACTAVPNAGSVPSDPTHGRYGLTRG
jgi:hypothetical protein